MKRIVIDVAGHRVALEHRYDYTPRLCGRFAAGGEPEFAVAVTEADIDAEADPQADHSRGYLESLALLRALCLRFMEIGVWLVHGVVVELDGRGYLFTAPSGTGKSTHMRLWKERFGERLRVVNGDKPFITVDPDGRLRAWGSPWCGKEGLSSTGSARLDGVAVIARGDTNRARLMPPGGALQAIFPQIYMGKQKTPRALRMAIPLTEKLVRLPVFRVECTISQEAVDASYEALSRS